MGNKENKNVIRLIIGFGLLLAFLFAINPISRGALGIYLFFLVVSFLVYSSRNYQNTLIGISTKNLGKSLIISTLLGGTFYYLAKIVPGLSVAVPLLPNAISDELKLFMIVFVAPICEEILFRGSLLGYIREFSPSKKNIIIAIIVQAVLFSLFHLGSYITGFYQLPGFATGVLALSANISAFISAFIFAIIAGVLAVNTKNLWSSMVLHLALNFIIYTTLTIAFV